MTEITVQATEWALGYLEDIAQEMVKLFAIDLDEARGRINRQFPGPEPMTEWAEAYLGHEDEEDWAKHIYYGRDSLWWRDDEPRDPLPYP
ncbi:MAG: hypothetical protein AAGC53_20425 [Actinomycetota bacterium]